MQDTRSWVRTEPANDPGVLYSPYLAYHRIRQTVILYGGSPNPFDPGRNSDQLWEYDGEDWRLLADDCPPGKRKLHGVVYDSHRDRLIVLLGEDDQGQPLDSAWEWDGLQWHLTPATGDAPSARFEFFFAYDAHRARTVVFGGTSTGSDQLGDLYEFDGTTWHRPASGEISPSARNGAGSSMTYDSHRQRVVLYGGHGSHDLDDLWAWNGTRWSQLCDDCTGLPRIAATMTYDPDTGRLVLTGGYDGNEIPGTWEYFEAAGFVLVDEDLVPKRDTSGITYDEKRKVIVLYGGNGDSCPGNCDDTYEYTF